MYEQDKVVCFVCGSMFYDDDGEMCYTCHWKKCPKCGSCLCSLSDSERRVAIAQCISYHAPTTQKEWQQKYALLEQLVILTTDSETKEAPT